MTDEGLWNTRQVQAYLGCSLRLVQKLIETRQLPARRIGRLVRLEPAEVRAFRKNLPAVGVPMDRRKRLQVLS